MLFRQNISCWSDRILHVMLVRQNISCWSGRIFHVVQVESFRLVRQNLPDGSGIILQLGQVESSRLVISLQCVDVYIIIINNNKKYSILGLQTIRLMALAVSHINLPLLKLIKEEVGQIRIVGARLGVRWDRLGWQGLGQG